MEKSDEKITFKFGLLRKLVVDLEKKKIYGFFGEVDFSDVVGAWKNYRKKGSKIVYYVQLLTKSKIYTITPEMERERDVKEILKTLKKILKIDKIRV